MGPAAPARRVARFGVFELDLRTGELRKYGHKVPIQGQPIQILILLTERAGELVTREELHQKLWPSDTFVGFEHGLNAAVKRLRQALDDSADTPRFVETLPRRGYRFIAPIEIVGASRHALDVSGAPPDQQPSGAGEQVNVAGKTAANERLRWVFSWKGASFASVLALALLTIWIFRPASPSGSIRSLAVLPLENLSGDPSQDYFSDGMTDELITELGQIRELRVISRTSVMTYKGVRKSLPKIARELNVDAVVEGTVLRSREQVRITAQLIHAHADKHLWAQSYEGDMREALALQKQVARAIAEHIRIELTPAERDVLKNVKAVNAEAYEAYLKGRYFWNKRTADGFRKAVDYFNQAIEKDPTYAPAYSGLADSYALLGDWEYGVLAPGEAYPKAKAAATKALELDNALGEAHISLAFTLDGFDWDFEAAGTEFKRGINLAPSYATGHQWYAGHLTLLGRSAEAIEEMKKAENLDPLSLIISADLAEDFLIANRYDEGVAQVKKTIDIDANFALAHYQLGQAFLQKHKNNEAIAELQKAVELSGGSTACTSSLAYAYALSGRKNEAVTILNDLKNRTNRSFSNAPEIALVYLGLDQRDQAMAWLETGYAERFNPGVLRRPAFDPLRSDPRFQDLLRRIGLSQ
jgi:TolB-like protein/DNA-binding winged helix-turn-helix (wHTH) protein/Flp pilus assembly protein TadD